jgi:hypothetical protein
MNAPGDASVGGDTYVNGDTYIGGETTTGTISAGGATVTGPLTNSGPFSGLGPTHNYGDVYNYTSVFNYGGTTIDAGLTISRGPTKVFGPTYVNNVPLTRQTARVITNLQMEGQSLKATVVNLTFFGKLSAGTKETVFTVRTATQEVFTEFDGEACSLSGEDSFTYVSELS